MIEEAHRLLRQPPPGTGNGPAAHAVEMFAELLAEVRAYGEGLVIAEQIPAKLIPDVIKNTAVKIVHRLPAADDRDTVGATMNLTAAQSAYLVTLPPGEAAVHADGMDYPLLARMPDGTAREAGTPALAASPARVIAARSGSCGPDCQQAPCTLRQMRAAKRAARRPADHPVGRADRGRAPDRLGSCPCPARPWPLLAACGPWNPAGCAISHAADAAVAARVPAIAGTPASASATGSGALGATALAAHVAAAMRAAVGDGAWPCQRDEPQWLAPAWQWEPLLDQLRTWDRDHAPASGRHPRTQELEARYSRAIPGRTCAEQAAAVQRWHDRSQTPTTNRAVLFGAHQPSAIEDALGARVADPDWPERLADALSAFNDCRWPLDLIREPEQET